ncbi:MAG: hypothetical protein MRY79_04030 [Alphaproteobacteria bacterium]|nr:hypothetical protein [Alphaproteobacteria bacterium]
MITGRAAALLTSRFRSTKWLDDTPRRQIQRKFIHARALGVKGNQNNKNLKKFRQALKDHVKSKDTIVIKGSYHRQPTTHYYNTKTKINVMKDSEGKLRSAWELTDGQVENILRSGNLGGSK